MINHNTTNFHVEYMDVTQHWSPTSEKYCGGDALLTAFYNGWEMDDRVLCEEKAFAGMRLIRVYHVEIKHNGEKHTMRVIDNPFVSRMMSNASINIVSMRESENTNGD